LDKIGVDECASKMKENCQKILDMQAA